MESTDNTEMDCTELSLEWSHNSIAAYLSVTIVKQLYSIIKPALLFLLQTFLLPQISVYNHDLWYESEDFHMCKEPGGL